jgi:hypothetical protein
MVGLTRFFEKMIFPQKTGVSANVCEGFTILQKMRFLPPRKKLFLQSPLRLKSLLLKAGKRGCRPAVFHERRGCKIEKVAKIAGKR